VVTIASSGSASNAAPRLATRIRKAALHRRLARKPENALVGSLTSSSKELP
jgi:hypothetical protein